MAEYIVDYELIPLKWRDGFGLSDVDLTEQIVRCRDCEYQGKPHECWLEATEPDEFCSRGKRKEGGE